jgi:hypothetical protein
MSPSSQTAALEIAALQLADLLSTQAADLREFARAVAAGQGNHSARESSSVTSNSDALTYTFGLLRRLSRFPAMRSDRDLNYV